MAINLFNKYGSRANPPSIDYPEGSIKNRSAPDVKDGTPLDADWANDHQGFFQSILSYFGVTANGTPDKVGASQYFDALFSNPTETLRGMPLVASQLDTDDGSDDAKLVTPKKLKNGFSVSLGTTGHIRFPSWLGGVQICWGRVINSTVQTSVTFSLAFPNEEYAIATNVAEVGSLYAITQFVNGTTSGGEIAIYSAAAASPPTINTTLCTVTYIAIGRG